MDFDVDLRRRCEPPELAFWEPEFEPVALVRLVGFEDLDGRSSVGSSGVPGVVLASRWRLAAERVTGPKYPSLCSDDSDRGGVGDMTRGVEGTFL